MRFYIRYRLDQEEFYCTDNHEFEAQSWEAVLAEIRSIESHNTVLELRRIDID